MPLSQREQLILKELEAPKTISDLLQVCDTGYYTVRNCIQALVEKGLVQECPWRKGREKQYRAGFFLENGQAIDKMQFSMFGQASTVLQISAASPLDEVYGLAGKLVRLAAIKPLWEFHVRTDESKLSTDGHPSKELIHERLSLVARNLEHLYQLAEQLLNAPIWENNNIPALLIGNDEVDWDHVQNLIRDLEQFALERGW